MASKDSDQALHDFILMKYDNLVMGRVIKSLGNAMFAVVYELKNKILVSVAKLKGKFTSKKAKRVLRVDTNSFVLISLDSKKMINEGTSSKGILKLSLIYL